MEPLRDDVPVPQLPVVLFPVTDLLLVGHTKRMHLFEPRWVDLVDSARKLTGGVFGMLYFAGNSSVLGVATMVEIIACNNLGEAGRMITVRGVGRALVKSISQNVASDEEWGVANVEEVQELRAEDVPCSDAAGAPEVVAEISKLIAELDLSVPQAASQAADATSSTGSDTDQEQDPSAPKLWTHERTKFEEDFTNLGGASWPKRCEAVRSCLANVPICRVGSLALGDDEAREAVVVLYAALGCASLSTRWELFLDTDRGAVWRLDRLSTELKERQGMASAKRAVASVFSDGQPPDDEQ